MRNFLLLLTMLFVTSCGQSFRTDEDSTLSGKVSRVLSNIGISTAYAQENERRMSEDLGKAVGGEVVSKFSDDSAVVERFSRALHNVEILGARLNPVVGSTYPELVENAFTALENVEQSLSSLSVSARPVLAGISKSESYPHGLGLALGFDENQQIKSISVFALSSTREYKFKDAAESKVKYYKLSFLFPTSDGGVEYRKSFHFTDGRQKVANVDFATTAAAVALVEQLSSYQNVLLDNNHFSKVQEVGKAAQVVQVSSASVVKDMKKIMDEKLQVVKSFSKFSAEEFLAVKEFLKAAYDQNFESNLTPIEKNVVYASMLTAIRTDSALRDAIVASKDQLEQGQYNSLIENEEKLTDAGKIIERLTASSLLPSLDSSFGAPSIRYGEEGGMEARQKAGQLGVIIE